MPLVGDIMRITIVQELAGLQVSNTLYIKITDLGDEPPPPDALAAVMTIYHDAVKDICGDAWSVVCGISENLTRIEGKTLRFLTLPGVPIEDTHPSDQVLRINQYAIDITPAPAVRRGSWNQTGVIKSLSNDGRVDSMVAILPLNRFLDTQFILAGPGWTCLPQMRYQPTPSPPPQTYAFERQALNQTSSRFFKLASRKTALCRLF